MQWLKETLELLAPGWVGSIIGLAGIVAAGITYFLTRQRTRFAYCNIGGRLLGLSEDGLPEDITVQYRGQEISRLTRTLVIFWNDGEKTISAEDIALADFLRLRLQGDGRVLAVTVLKQSRAVCQVKMQHDPLNPTEVAISFAFLDSRDGAVAEVLHTCESRHMDFLGTIRGLPNGLHNLGRVSAKNNLHFIQRRFLASPRKVGWVTFALGLIMTSCGFLLPWQELEKTLSSEWWIDRAVFMGLGSLYILLGLILLFLLRRKYPKSLHIEEFD